MIVGLCLFGTAAHAGSGAAAPADPCARSRDEAALLACRQKQAAQTEQRMERLLQRLQQRDETDEPERVQLLLDSQAKWLPYRDAECRLRTYESRGGRGYEAYRLACIAGLNSLRAKDLQRQVDNP